tara:strand:- start:475 stop:588 length:114 start_codon:yes stop_codon:yes gene_type:complete
MMTIGEFMPQTLSNIDIWLNECGVDTIPLKGVVAQIG